jgi:MFS family permease
MSLLDVDRRVLSLAFARMADSLANSFLIIVLPLYIASGAISLEGIVGGRVLGVAVTEELLIGIALSLFGFLNSFGQPFTGRLSDRVGKRRRFIVGGLVLLAVASAGYPFARSYWQVLVLRMLQGVGAALTVPATVALVNELATSDDRGGNFGLFNTFRLIGFGFGPIIAGSVVVAGPYRLGGTTVSGFDAAFGVAVAGALVGITLVMLLVSDPEATRAAAADDLAISVRDPAGRHVLDPVFAVGVATFFMAISIALYATLEGRINDRLVQNELWFGLQFSAVVIANVVLQTPIGSASDRWGRKPFLVGGFVLLAPAVLAQGYVTSSWLMLGARLVQGVGVAMVFAPGLALAGDLAGEGQSGTKLSVLTMAFGLGTAVGPLLSGWLVFYGFAVPFLVAAALALAGLVLVSTQVEETVEDAAAAAPAVGD